MLARSIRNTYGARKGLSNAISNVRNLYIQTSSTPNEDAIKFLPSQDVLGSGQKSVEYLSGRQAHASPLARKLFALQGVRSVLFGCDFVTVEKKPQVDWLVLKPEIYSVLTEHLTQGLPVITEGTSGREDTRESSQDSEVVSAIKELIDTRIRPAIQEDGGDLEYCGFTDDGVVLIKLQGACRSCDSSTVTLKNGIEAMLMHYVDEVKAVEQVSEPYEQVSKQVLKELEDRLETKDRSVKKSEEDDEPESPPSL